MGAASSLLEQYSHKKSGKNSNDNGEDTVNEAMMKGQIAYKKWKSCLFKSEFTFFYSDNLRHL